MGWFDWFWNVLAYLGLSNKSGKVLFLGLDNAGKTTLLQMLRSGTLGSHKPTIHANIEELSMGSLTLKTYDVGGHMEARRLWRDFFVDVDAVVFLVDSSDRRRFAEARHELDELFRSPDLKDIPFAILGNKVDLPNAASPEELTAALGLEQVLTGRSSKPRPGVRPVELFPCSVVKRTGYGDAFRWLADYLRNV